MEDLKVIPDLEEVLSEENLEDLARIEDEWLDYWVSAEPPS